ncbi:MAG: class I SAM-dependent methyltransferase [Hyphomonas sp.]|nr:class I SAM-dependent methyltransferase [Hyphomonas sp.]
MSPAACPVCAAPGPAPYLSDRGRDYWVCAACEACFLDPAQHLPRSAERAHYLHHRNDPADPGYRRFLSKLAGPLLARLPAASQGLDYGCGPGPALAGMLREAGHNMALYDPIFQPDTGPLRRTYDFVTCTETAEHFHQPAAEFARMMALVRPGGLLAVMTGFHPCAESFRDWPYRQDATHVVFYRAATFRQIAAQQGWACEIPVADVAFLHRPLAPAGA